MRSKHAFLAIGSILLTATACAVVVALSRRNPSIAPFPDAEVERTMTDKGVTYKLHRGNLYRVDEQANRWVFAQQVYDPDFYAKNYLERDGAIYRKGSDGQQVPVTRRIDEGFEDAADLSDLIGFQRGWTSFELQSPKAPTVDQYVRLRNRILKESAGFLDNRVEPSEEVVHAGARALKAVAVPPSWGMVTAKASLSTELLHFIQGDDVWMAMWCYVPSGSGMPFTVLDLETTWIQQYPGMRIVLADGKHACFQLKAFEHPYYRQQPGKEIVFPTGKWVHLKAHLKLSDRDDGVIELWQDGQQIVDARGPTLVLEHAIYNSLEVGISAYNEQSKSATLYVDDVKISDEPL